ncbi:HNH endonuclease [Bacillus sp. FJAT-27231]|uniref:HNH endonuclease n=1 Tax=Bacillus sp. FJAT-27231 TaxID=1679168 RepID=UPI00069F86BA|nr:HNH endonuclease [Bacillus sp. FJAT-27231]
MGAGRWIGKTVGKAGGTVIGGAVKLGGKALKQKWIEEAGDSVKTASAAALENAGQFVDGAVQGTYGLVKKDEHYQQQGLADLKDSAGKTIKGIGGTIKYTAGNAAEVVKGAAAGDKDQALNGLKNIGKVAVVTTFAIGVIDLVDGADIAEAEEIDTRNDHLSGYEHPETGVPFVEKTVELPGGDRIEGTFPVFDSEFRVVIAEELYWQSDDIHFAVANETLHEAIEKNPGLADELGLNTADKQALAAGDTPPGYVWHHSEEPGTLELIDKEVHHQTGHTGGRELWGGGAEYR